MLRSIRWLAVVVLLGIAGALACSNPTGPDHKKYTGPLHDPEVFLHFAYIKDSTGQYVIEPYPDTAMLFWYRGVAPLPDSLVAQAEITGVDSLCGFFLLPEADTAHMTIALGWKRHGTTMTTTQVGPYAPANPLDWGPYFEVTAYEDTVASSQSFGISSSLTTSFCPAGVRRDSINVKPLS